MSSHLSALLSGCPAGIHGWTYPARLPRPAKQFPGPGQQPPGRNRPTALSAVLTPSNRACDSLSPQVWRLPTIPCCSDPPEADAPLHRPCIHADSPRGFEGICAASHCKLLRNYLGTVRIHHGTVLVLVGRAPALCDFPRPVNAPRGAKILCAAPTAPHLRATTVLRWLGATRHPCFRGSAVYGSRPRQSSPLPTAASPAPHSQFPNKTVLPSREEALPGVPVFSAAPRNPLGGGGGEARRVKPDASHHSFEDDDAEWTRRRPRSRHELQRQVRMLKRLGVDVHRIWSRFLSCGIMVTVTFRLCDLLPTSSP